MLALLAASLLAQEEAVTLAPKKKDFYSRIHAVAFSEGGQLLASGATCGKVVLWSTETGKKERELLGSLRPEEGRARSWWHYAVSSLAFKGKGTLYAAGGDEVGFL